MHACIWTLISYGFQNKSLDNDNADRISAELWLSWQTEAAEESFPDDPVEEGAEWCEMVKRVM